MASNKGVSSTALKVLLDKKEYCEVGEYLDASLAGSGSDVQLLIESSLKAVNLIAFHLFHTQCEPEGLGILLQRFRGCLVHLAENSASLSQDQATKVLTSIFHVLKGRLVKEEDFRSAAPLAGTVAQFAASVVDRTGDSDMLFHIWQSFALLAKRGGDGGEGPDFVVEQLLIPAFRIVFSGTTASKKEARYPKVMAELVAVVRACSYPDVLGFVRLWEDFRASTSSAGETMSAKARLHHWLVDVYLLEQLGRELRGGCGSTSSSRAVVLQEVDRTVKVAASCMEAAAAASESGDCKYLDRYSLNLVLNVGKVAQFLLWDTQQQGTKALQAAAAAALELVEAVFKHARRLASAMRPPATSEQGPPIKLSALHRIKYDALVALGRYREAMGCCLPLAVSLHREEDEASGAVSGSDSVGTLFLVAKQKLLSSSSSGSPVAADLTMLDFKGEEALSSSDRAMVLETEIALYRRYPEYNARLVPALRDQLLQLEPLLTATTDKVACLIERVWSGYFEKSSSSSPAVGQGHQPASDDDNDNDLVKVCERAIALGKSSLGEEPLPRSWRQRRSSLYLGLATLWLFLVKREALSSRSGGTDDDNNEAAATADTENWEPVTWSTVSLATDAELLQLLDSALGHFKASTSSSSSTGDGGACSCDHYVTKRVVVSSLAVIAEAYCLFGDHGPRHRESLDALISSALHFGLEEFVALAALAASKSTTTTSEQSGKAMRWLLQKSQQQTTSGQPPSVSHLTALLALGWQLRWSSRNEAQLGKVEGLLAFLLNSAGSMAKTLQQRLLLGEIKFLAVLVRKRRGSVVKLPGDHRLQELGSMELASSCVRTSYGCLVDTKSQDLGDGVLSALRAKRLALGSRGLLLEVYRDLGMELETPMMAKCLVRIAKEVASATRICQSLLAKAEVSLIHDDPAGCIVELAEVERILGRFVCEKDLVGPVRGGFRKGAKKADKLELPDEAADLGTSPALPRYRYRMPRWLGGVPGEAKPEDRPPRAAHPETLLTLSIIVNQFLTLWAVSCHQSDDPEGASWTLGQAEAAADATLKQAAALLQTGSSSQLVLRTLARLMDMQGWEVDVLGQLRDFQGCQAKLARQRRILATAGRTSLLHLAPTMELAYTERCLAVLKQTPTPELASPVPALALKHRAKLTVANDPSDDILKTPLTDRRNLMLREALKRPQRRRLPPPGQPDATTLPKVQQELVDVESEEDANRHEAKLHREAPLLSTAGKKRVPRINLGGETAALVPPVPTLTLTSPVLKSYDRKKRDPKGSSSKTVGTAEDPPDLTGLTIGGVACSTPSSRKFFKKPLSSVQKFQVFEDLAGVDEKPVVTRGASARKNNRPDEALGGDTAALVPPLPSMTLTSPMPSSAKKIRDPKVSTSKKVGTARDLPDLAGPMNAEVPCSTPSARKSGRKPGSSAQKFQVFEDCAQEEERSRSTRGASARKNNRTDKARAP